MDPGRGTRGDDKGEFALSAQFADFFPVFGDLVAAITDSGDIQVLQDGDSGGPLFNVTTLCGVNARAWLSFSLARGFWDCKPIICVPDTDICSPLPVHCEAIIQNHHTTIDLPHQKEFILGEIVDPTGVRFKGICDEGPLGLRDIDTNGDLIPDACDPCPFSADSDYDLSTTPDPDQDDAPDRCDNCPNIFNPITQADIPGGATLNSLNSPQRNQDGDSRGESGPRTTWPFASGSEDPSCRTRRF